MQKLRVAPGHLLAIPLSRSFAVAKVVYVSKLFRDIMGLRVQSRSYPDLPEAISLSYEWLPGLLYTATLAVPRHWKVIGQAAVTAEELSATRRIVEVRVFELDHDCGPASEE
jgi:hypothetical protein